MSNFFKEIPVVTARMARDGKNIDPNWLVHKEPVYQESAILALNHVFGDMIKINLSYIPEDVRYGVLRRLMNGGKEFEGTTYYVSSAMSATKSCVVPAFSIKGVGADWFPKDKDVIRLGALHTPGGVFAGYITVHVKHVKDGEYGTGDGQIRMSKKLHQRMWPDQTLEDGTVIHQPEAGGPLRGAYEGLKVEDKGAFCTADDLPADLVVPWSSCKGHTEDMPEDMICDIYITVMAFAERQVSDLSWQVMETVPEEVVDAMVSQWDMMVKEAELNGKDPLTWVKAKGTPSMRDDRGRILDTGILHRAALFCLKANNNDLLMSPRINKIIADKWAAENLCAVVSGGVRGVGLMAFFKADIANGIVMCNPHDLREGKYVAIRNPFPNRTAAVAVRIVTANWVPKGTCWSNGVTLSRTQNDFDSDYIVFASCDYTHINVWHNWLSKLPYAATVAKRAEGADKRFEDMPKDRADMINRIMTVDIGRVANLIRNLYCLLWIKPEHAAEIEVFIFEASVELIKAVDSAKHASLPDWDKVKRMEDWCESHGLTNMDTYFSALSNGTIKPWTYSPKEIASPWQDEDDHRPNPAAIKKGQYVLPWEYVSDRTPIGRAFNELGPRLPRFTEKAMSSTWFQNYLVDIGGEGAKYCSTLYKKSMDAIRKTGIIEDVVAKEEARREVMKNWQESCQKIQAEKPLDFQKQFVSRLWHLQFSGESTQFFLWNSIPEVIFDLLDERADSGALTAVQPTVQSYVIGREFNERFLPADKEVVSLNVRFIKRPNNRLAIIVDGDTVDYGVDEDISRVVVERATLEVRRGKTAGRTPFTLYGMTVEGQKAIEMEATAF